MFTEPSGETEIAWTFGYQSLKYIETGDIKYALAGGFSLLVDKRSGEVRCFGSGLSCDEAMENYRKWGDPHASPGDQIEIKGWNEGANVIDAIKGIRDIGGIGLKDAKAIVDRCLDGSVERIQLSTDDQAERLANSLSEKWF